MWFSALGGSMDVRSALPVPRSWLATFHSEKITNSAVIRHGPIPASIPLAFAVLCGRETDLSYRAPAPIRKNMPRWKPHPLSLSRRRERRPDPPEPAPLIM